MGWVWEGKEETVVFDPEVSSSLSLRAEGTPKGA